MVLVLILLKLSSNINIVYARSTIRILRSQEAFGNINNEIKVFNSTIVQLLCRTMAYLVIFCYLKISSFVNAVLTKEKIPVTFSPF